MIPETATPEIVAMPPRRKRFVVVDDHPFIAYAFRGALGADPELELAAALTSAAETFAYLTSNHVDGTVVEICLGDGPDGLELVKRLRAVFPRLPILMLSRGDGRVYGLRALRAGANGYFEKTSDPEVIIAGLRRILAGEPARGAVVSLLNGLLEPLKVEAHCGSVPSYSWRRWRASRNSGRAATGSMSVSRRPPTSSVILRNRPRPFSFRSMKNCFRSMTIFSEAMGVWE
jgi:DNA-binding response OmpR family regulator